VNIDTIGYGIVVLGAIAIIGVGIGYIMRPFAMAPTFGLPTLPEPGEIGWLNLKGIRDVASGLMLSVAAIGGSQSLLAAMLLVAAITPIGDAGTILRRHGSRSAAFSVHGVTAAVLLIGALLLTI
jgi:hypothetical protein